MFTLGSSVLVGYNKGTVTEIVQGYNSIYYYYIKLENGISVYVHQQEVRFFNSCLIYRTIYYLKKIVKLLKEQFVK